MSQVIDLQAAIVIGVSLAFGGLLKGATGAGTPNCCGPCHRGIL